VYGFELGAASYAETCLQFAAFSFILLLLPGRPRHGRYHRRDSRGFNHSTVFPGQGEELIENKNRIVRYFALTALFVWFAGIFLVDMVNKNYEEGGDMMKKRTLMFSIPVSALLVSLAALFSCGGGGGGGGATLSPPAFTNLAGTRWSTTDTVSTSANSCGAAQGDSDSWIAHVLAESGNTISIYDERSGASSAIDGTISGSVITVSGPRYAIGGCSNMTASYSVTLNGAGTSFSGTATITCLDAPSCTVPVNVTGTKI
jgi:hypothetical protein